MHLFPVLFLKLLSPSLTESAVAVFFFFSGCSSFRFEVVNEENWTGRKTKPKNKKREEKSRCIQISKDTVFLARGKNTFCQLASWNPDWAQRQREQVLELLPGLCGQDYIPRNLQQQFSERWELVQVLSVPAHSHSEVMTLRLCAPLL